MLGRVPPGVVQLARSRVERPAFSPSVTFVRVATYYGEVVNPQIREFLAQPENESQGYRAEELKLYRQTYAENLDALRRAITASGGSVMTAISTADLANNVGGVRERLHYVLVSLHNIVRLLNDSFGEEEVEPEAEKPKAEEAAPDSILVRDKDNVAVYLDNHQNKHQHGNSMIAEFGAWKAKKGSTFKAGKGLAWHKENTAVTIANWALAQNLSDGQVKYPSKTKPLADGYIYDAKVERTGTRISVVYHCNPPSNEK